jgi:hypothetical protein
MLLIDISYVQTSTVSNPSQYLPNDQPDSSSNSSTSNPSKLNNKMANIHRDRKTQHDKRNKDHKHFNTRTSDNLVIKSLFRELIPKAFVEQLVVLVLAQIQHGHKLRHFLPTSVVPITAEAMLRQDQQSSLSDLSYTLSRQQSYLLLTLPSLKIELLRQTPQLPYTLVSPGTEVAIGKSSPRNLYQFSVYIEQLLIPTLTTITEYLHSTQPMLWESVATLLGTACHSKFLQIRFASLSSFLSLLQPQSCIHALITARGGAKAGVYVSPGEEPQTKQHHGKSKGQPQWSNEFFHACFPLFVPIIAEMLQDSSLHVQRLAQNVVRLSESISGEPFAKYLSTTH